MFVHCCLFSEKLTTMLKNTVCSLQSYAKNFARAKMPGKMARARVQQKDDRKKGIVAVAKRNKCSKLKDIALRCTEILHY